MCDSYTKNFCFYETELGYCLEKQNKKDYSLLISNINGEITKQNILEKKEKTFCFGLIGIIDLHSSPLIIFATDAELVSLIGNDKIYKITKMTFIRCNKSKETQIDKECLKALKEYLEIPGFYFSYTYDLTKSLQDKETKNKIENWCFNSFAQKKILNLVKKKEIEQSFLFPIIHGSVFSFSCSLYNKKELSIILITRKMCKRQGARYHTRGIDSFGYVSNYMETEQIVMIDKNIFSFVQLRGSIPIFWAQTVNLRYKPKLLIFKEKLGSSFEKHFSMIKQNNKKLSVLDLIDQKGYESILSKEFSYQCRLKKENYIQIDFHKESKKGSIEKKIHSIISETLLRDGYFHKNKLLIRKQEGVIRTNCVDCLDRTNVAQTIMAFEQFKQILKECEFDLETIKEKENIVNCFKEMWKENGNMISIQYSGTNALKSGYKDSGLSKFKSLLKDFSYSITRYWKANFTDYLKQEGADLFLGECVLKRNLSPFLKQKRRSLTFFFFVLFFLFLFVHFDIFYVLYFSYILLPSIILEGIFYARYPRFKDSSAYIPSKIMEE